MTYALAGVASATVDFESSSTDIPPAITFPYPDDDRDGDTRDGDSSRVDSEATLYNHQSEIEGQRLDPPKSQPEHSSLAERNIDTDKKRSTPLVALPQSPSPQSLISSPDDGCSGETPRQSQASEELAISSDDDENHLSPRKSRTQPVPSALSKSHLNNIEGQSSRRRHFTVGNEHFKSLGRIARDGRLNISVRETANSGYLAKAWGQTIEHHLRPQTDTEVEAAERAKVDFKESKAHLKIPPMNIVIMVIGSRGDIQPFLRIGQILRDKYKHRVRIATHPTFRNFVEKEIGLEFFSVGGDPSELMAFMVKNPGLVPSLETVRAGEIGRRRESMFQMFQGFWRACINATDDELDVANLKMMGSKPPFVADAIIANPPSFAHYHCAERLSIPLHLVFTFPYSPTQDFPHPLANIKTSNVDQSYTNLMSYPLVDLMTWQGLGDLVNRFRVQTLGLEPVSTLWAPGQLSRLKIPITYLWSPSLAPKPKDWGPEIDIAGYVFLELASSFKPPEDLANFLKRPDGRKIVYIGFGSIAGIQDPKAFTKMVFEAVEKADVRAIVGKGWGGMGEGMEKPDGVFMVDNVPHDWLFPQVDAVVHHGGAGTTAAGLRFGKPTMIIPFFGDQPFWSAMVARAEAGAKEALPLKKLNSDKFAEGIRQCLGPYAKAKAADIARSIEKEGCGAENAVDSFHRQLPLGHKASMRCDVFPDHVAVWRVKHSSAKLSTLGADLLVENKKLQWSDLDLIKHQEWNDFQGPGEPITGAGGVLVNTFQDALHGLTSIQEYHKKDWERYERKRRKLRYKSVADGIVIPGQIAFAARGPSIEAVKVEQAQLSTKVNLSGTAQPFKPFRGDDNTDVAIGSTPLHRHTTNDSTLVPSAPVIVAKDVARTVYETVRPIVAMPSKMFFAMALGFHNAPRLYGDQTVRPAPRKITGFRSGSKAAGKDFAHGIYDGVTGLVRIPRMDVKEDGVSGLPKGIARGIGGLVLKPLSGSLGLVAYFGKGVHMNLRRRLRDTEKTDRFIRRARIAQGQREIHQLRNKPSPPGSRLSGELDVVRAQALRRWDTHAHEMLQPSRETEKALVLTQMHEPQSTQRMRAQTT